MDFHDRSGRQRREGKVVCEPEVLRCGRQNGQWVRGRRGSIDDLDEGLARLHIDRGVGWEQQGFPGFKGYGWYFQNLEVPDELFAKNHLYLYFLRRQ